MSNERSAKDGGGEGRRYSYVQLDVFTERPLEGNALAVFTDARGMSDAEMQAVARETHLSETTFVLPRDPAVEREHGVRVRIFTTEEELPFAGHPTLGTAFALRGPDRRPGAGGATRAGSGPSEIVLELEVGRIPVEFTAESGGQVFGEMRQVDPTMGESHSREDIARVAGLEVQDLSADLPIQTVSTGLAFAIVPVKTRKTLEKLALDWKRVAEYTARTEAKFLYFVTRECVDREARMHARMIFYNGEDPATGSAAGCAAAWMVEHGVAKADERVLIEQGLEALRPSRIFVRAGKEGARVVNVRVGGHAVEVMRGELFL
ncbi:MAG TPA: PhzF family phenazine biosynthesis protein [Terriglobales bacterium]|nr:PhzF family phenazine biosynthesis protein [Terriglobales bacterium]